MDMPRLKFKNLKQNQHMKLIEKNEENTGLNNLMYNRGININVHTVHGGKK